MVRGAEVPLQVGPVGEDLQFAYQQVESFDNEAEDDERYARPAPGEKGPLVGHVISLPCEKGAFVRQVPFNIAFRPVRFLFMVPPPREEDGFERRTAVAKGLSYPGDSEGRHVSFLLCSNNRAFAEKGSRVQARGVVSGYLKRVLSSRRREIFPWLKYPWAAFQFLAPHEMTNCKDFYETLY